jgi:hypothetical protein
MFKKILQLATIFSILFGCQYIVDAATKLNTPINSRLTSGLVGLWSFDGADLISTTAYDRSGQGNNATLTGFGTTATTSKKLGVIGQALQFDGVADYVLTGTFASIPSSVTLSAWIYPTAGGVVLDEIGSGGGWHDSQMEVLSTGEIKVGYWTGSLSSISLGTFSLNAWHHVVLTYDTTSTTGKGYVDGVFRNSMVLTKQWPGSALQYGIGYADVATNMGDGTYFNGKIDDVRIYNRALSASEVSTLYTIGQATLQKSQNAKFRNGLTHLWSFDGADFSANTKTLYDRAGSTNGTMVAWATTTQLVGGVIGQAFNFNGTSQYVTLADINTAAGPPSSFALWFKRGQTSAASDEGLIGYSGSGCGGQNVWGIAIASGANTNKVFLTVGINGDYSTGTITDRNWHHLVVTLDGTNVRFYIDGALDSTVADSRTFTCTASSAFAIGVVNTSNWYKGAIDDIRIYNRVLPLSEVKNLYVLGKATLQKSQNQKISNGLAGLWSFDGQDISNGVALDRSGNSNNGNLINIASSTFYTMGRLGQAFNFNGTNNYVSVSDSASLNFTSAMTASAWINSSNPSVSFPMIVTKSNGSANFPFELRLSNTRIPQFGVSTNGAYTYITGNTQIATSTWYHIAGVYDGANLNMYVNGISDTTAVPVTGTMTSASYGTLIGARNSVAPEYFFPGKIDDVRLYNRALSASEIKRLYSIGK